MGNSPSTSAPTGAPTVPGDEISLNAFNVFSLEFNVVFILILVAVILFLYCIKKKCCSNEEKGQQFQMSHEINNARIMAQSTAQQMSNAGNGKITFGVKYVPQENQQSVLGTQNGYQGNMPPVFQGGSQIGYNGQGTVIGSQNGNQPNIPPVFQAGPQYQNKHRNGSMISI
eukprot:snap_masked-scaffold_3-processed-gene-21.83-mRNA-1 protein AED:1.00 eAED:1.00 QI:0/-1/0/0/-1/1/1/0/170